MSEEVELISGQQEEQPPTVFDPETVSHLISAERIVTLRFSSWLIASGVEPEHCQITCQKIAERLNQKTSHPDSKLAGKSFHPVDGQTLLTKARSTDRIHPYTSFVLGEKAFNRHDQLVIDASPLKPTQFWELIARFSGRWSHSTIVICQTVPLIPEEIKHKLGRHDLSLGTNAYRVVYKGPDYQLERVQLSTEEPGVQKRPMTMETPVELSPEQKLERAIADVERGIKGLEQERQQMVEKQNQAYARGKDGQKDYFDLQKEIDKLDGKITRLKANKGGLEDQYLTILDGQVPSDVSQEPETPREAPEPQGKHRKRKGKRLRLLREEAPEHLPSYAPSRRKGRRERGLPRGRTIRLHEAQGEWLEATAATHQDKVRRPTNKRPEKRRR